MDVENSKLIWEYLVNNYKSLNLDNLKINLIDQIDKKKFHLNNLVIFCCILLVENIQFYKNIRNKNLLIIRISCCKFNEYIHMKDLFLRDIEKKQVKDIVDVDNYVQDDMIKSLIIAIEKLFINYTNDYINSYPIVSIGKYNLITNAIEDIYWRSDYQLKNIILKYV
jgi:hypothetical protein